MAAFDFDSIVIGSGFGGAVSACRMAEQGMKVLVLERGRRWTPETYPRALDDPWLWNQSLPQRFNGWVDLRAFSKMWVVAGAGVGGGSLIYANISVPAEPGAFQQGWPPEITHAALQPYYQRVAEMLDVQMLPDNQINPRFVLMRQAAEKCGWGERFHKLPLAVSFDPDFALDISRIPDGHNSKAHINRFGKHQGTCIHCGNCDIGCKVQAKNTLDLNYLAVAESHGAEIRPLHLVTNLEPCGDGWRVHSDHIVDGSRKPCVVTAQRVILGAGSIGSTELLLRCRDEHHSLPKLSQRLGTRWAFNGDFVSASFYKDRRISPTRGPTISCAIDLLDYSFRKQALFIEDGGLPNLLTPFVRQRRKRASRLLRRVWKDFARAAPVEDPLESMMLWFGQAVDASDGRMYLGRHWLAPWRRTLKMHWDYRRSAPVVDAMADVHRRLAASTGGDCFVPPTWTLWHHLITPHPLGGCGMGITPADGVVDANGKVFCYDNLYVMDGSAVPRALGLNPSRTIAALAERNIETLCRRG